MRILFSCLLLSPVSPSIWSAPFPILNVLHFWHRHRSKTPAKYSELRSPGPVLWGRGFQDITSRGHLTITASCMAFHTSFDHRLRWVIAVTRHVPPYIGSASCIHSAFLALVMPQNYRYRAWRRNAALYVNNASGIFIFHAKMKGYGRMRDEKGWFAL